MAQDGQAFAAMGWTPADAAPEARFLLAALASGRCAGDPTGSAPEPPPGIDWSRFVMAARRHRVSLLLNPQAIATLPDTARGAWKATRSDGILAVALAEETGRLAGAFDRAGLPALFLKGAPLSLQLYGDPCARTPRDIDVLIRPEAFQAAVAVLAGCGYAVIPGELYDDGRLKFYHAGLRHAVYGFVIELHVRLSDDERVLPLALLRPFDNATTVLIGGVAIPTLRAETAVVYAVYHGTRHLWRRLVWIADLTAAARSDAFDWDDVLSQIHACGLEGGLTTGLALGRTLLGGALPPGLDRFPKAMREGERLAALLAPMIATAEPMVHEDRVMHRLGRLPFVRLEFGLYSRTAARWAIIAEHLRPSPTDRKLLPLQGRWAVLLYVFRLVRALGVMWSERRRGG